jgi:hypothetical protein
MVPIDMTRFTQICGMLGSDQDGERAAAAFQATKMLRNAGLTWAELLKHVSERQNESNTADAKGKTTRDNGWRACDIVHRCAANIEDLTEWQRSFVVGCLPFANRYGASFRLSPKQWAQFHKIISQLEERAA